jgi:hypothetical protein
MAFDAQSAWTEMLALVASKPNHGRHDLLAASARIAERHTIPEEEFQRALRLTLPAFAELLFQGTARTQAPQDPADDVPVAGEPLTGTSTPSYAVQPTIAA